MKPQGSFPEAQCHPGIDPRSTSLLRDAIKGKTSGCNPNDIVQNSKSPDRKREVVTQKITRISQRTVIRFMALLLIQVIAGTLPMLMQSFISRTARSIPTKTARLMML